MDQEDMKNDLKLLHLKKSNLLKKITDLHKISINIVIGSDDYTEFKVRFNKLESDYKSINACQNEIFKGLIALDLTNKIDEEQKTIEEVDKMYFDILAVNEKLCSKFDDKPVENVIQKFTPQVKLPQIDLPTFNGNLKDWPHFRDMFHSLIHDNESLPDIEKFHYLVSCLKSEPLSLSKTLPLTNQNYAIIWNQLKDRYDNKRLLAACYLEEILHAPSLPNESSKKLRPFLDLLSENSTALKAMRFPIDYGDFVLCHVALQKLDKHTRQLFERKHSNSEFPTLENLLTFLKDHCKSLEQAFLLDTIHVRTPQSSSNNATKPNFNQYNKFTSNKFSSPQTNTSAKGAFLSTNAQDQVPQVKCLYCSKEHTIYRCPDFNALTTLQRKEFIVNKQACFNCLSHGHTSKSCGSKLLCRKCSRHHHTMLHESPQTRSDESSTSKMRTAEPQPSQPLHESPPTASPVTSHIGTSTSTTLLGTALIQIQDSKGTFHTARALCDPGSQVSFITKECASKMSLPFKNSDTPIQGISQSAVKTSNQSVSCSVKPCHKTHPCLQVNAIVLDCITAPLPCHTLPPNIKEFYKHLDLADPFFDVPNKIDVLLGADLFAEVFDGGRKPLKFGYPTPFKTIFGWVLIGKTMINENVSFATSNLCISDPKCLDTSLKKFWEMEEPPHKVHVSPNDKLAEDIFTLTTKRTDTGRYVVKLPFQNETPLLGESKNAATRSFSNLEHRLSQNSDLKEQYSQFMQEYLQLGHMRPIDVNKIKPEYFIPHHEVFKLSQDGKTRQIRVVFNASAKTSNGRSLNDELLTGPKLQNDVCEIISKFRLSPVVFTADIAKMYRQILVHPDHQTYQAILWRANPQEPVSCYLLNTVTYGVSSAPFQAIRTLQQLAKDEGQSFPLAADALTKDIFVDDILTGSSSLENAISLKSELISLLKLGGFELKKWASNHPELLQDSESSKEITFNESNTIKVLGIKWQPKTDCFSYEVDVKKHVVTKRSILSLLSSIYDPLGWVTPTILWAKKLMQTLWTSGVDWDETLNEDIVKSWSQFVSELPLLESIQLPRLVLPSNTSDIQLHAFCDASSEGYGACLYLRCVSEKGITTKLVMAKSKVAPLKSLTIPKLELCAAVLLCKLVDFYSKAVSEKLGQLTIFAWTDSTVSLSWIRTSPHLLKTFVANRVATIQDVIEPSRWCYVPTQDNPADCPSRGLLPSKIVNNELWWNGPEWLSKEPSTWPPQEKSHFHLEEIPETKHTVVSFVTQEENKETKPEFLKTFSSLTRLQRITAWCFRFMNNCKTKAKDKRINGPLTTSELNKSLNIWIHLVQVKDFNKEMTNIASKRPLKPEYQRLDPFIDEEGLLRVGGRLRHSSLQYSARHPVILPKDSHLTTLLIDHYHKTYFHAGPTMLQSLIQRSYWILSARNSIRKRISRCIKCTRMKAKSPQPFMADLPDYRVNNYRPFLKVGIDFGGPFFIKSERSRNPKILKAYLCLFICLSTKALHLEVVSNLSTEAFLAAFDRFIARRGLCTHVYTDRGSNFVGAKSTLNELYQILQKSENKDKISSSLSSKGINWCLNPPSAPHFGGIWEAGIKSAKSHLHRIIGEQKLTFEELSTIFTQIEAILNSRPLCLLSTDPGEVNALTPGHFLIGQPLVCLPQPDLTAIPQNRLSRWQLLNQARQHFWNRWSSEYLHTLQQRSKWTSRHNPSVKINDVVLIKESNHPPQVWRMGRITTLLPGKDGITRVVKLRTNDGELIRPLVKLCPLPIYED